MTIGTVSYTHLAVLLSEGETFSVVVKLTNTQYPYPFAVEGTILPESYGEPKYLGDGGESYLSADGVTWWDAAEKFHSEEGYDYYMTNVCIKAFTNPISTVSFSQQEGPIAFGEKVELTSPGADAVYYTTDGLSLIHILSEISASPEPLCPMIAISSLKSMEYISAS